MLEFLQRYLRGTAAGGLILQTLLTTGAWADGPTLKRLFPAGAARGQTVEVTALGEAPKWPVKVWSDDSSITWEPQSDKGKFKVSVAGQARLGVHHVRFYDEDNATDCYRFVVGQVPEINEVESTDGLDKLPVVSDLPKLINGVLEKRGDVDTFAVELKEGQPLFAECQANQWLRSPVDVTLQVLSSRGAVLAQNLDSVGLDPRVVFHAPRDGRYFVRVFGFPETPDSTINFAGNENFVYRLTLATGNVVTATTPLAVKNDGSTALKLMGVGLKQDAFDIQLPEALRGLPQVWLDVPGLVANSPVDVVTLPLDVETAPSDKPQTLSVPGSVSGWLRAPKERDRYAIEAAKDTKLRISVHARRLGFPTDAQVQVFDADGKQVAREDDTNKQADVRLAFAPPKSGSYVIEVSDVFRSGGPEHRYRLDVEPIKPTADISVKADHFQAKLNTALEIPVTIDRRDGFDRPLVIRVKGLPADVTCEAVTSAKDGATAKEVKLSLKASSAYSGPFEIVAEATGESGSDAATQISQASSTSDPLVKNLWLIAR